MKSKHHLKTRYVWVQATDGAVFKIKIFSKISNLKLNIDVKSHALWQEFLTTKANENFITKFAQKFCNQKA